MVEAQKKVQYFPGYGELCIYTIHSHSPLLSIVEVGVASQAFPRCKCMGERPSRPVERIGIPVI